MAIKKSAVCLLIFILFFLKPSIASAYLVEGIEMSSKKTVDGAEVDIRDKPLGSRTYFGYRVNEEEGTITQMREVIKVKNRGSILGGELLDNVPAKIVLRDEKTGMIKAVGEYSAGKFEIEIGQDYIDRRVESGSTIKFSHQKRTR